MAKIINFKDYQRDIKGKVQKKAECNCIACQMNRNGYAEIEVPASMDVFSVVTGIMQELTLADMVVERARAIARERERQEAKEKDKGPIDT